MGATPFILRQGQVGHVRSGVQTLTAAATVSLQGNDTLVLDSSTNFATTIATTPKAGDYLEIICLDTNTAHTVVLPSGVTWDGTNDTLTFDADGERVVARAISATRWFLVANPDSVAAS